MRRQRKRGLRLAPDWRRILRRAWSVRLMVLAAALTGIEVLLPLLDGQVRRGTFALLSLVVVIAALIARIMAQRGMR